MEAFVYCWYNEDTKKKYIGYHKGNVDDGYVSSSCNDRFWKDYNEGKLKRQIIAHGSVQDCQNLERKIFENIDWKSDEYYNIAVGGSINFALNNPMFREETKKYFSELHKNRIFTDEWKNNISKSLTGKKQSEQTKIKRSKRLIGNQNALGNKLSDNHKKNLREKALNNNPMKNEESRKKVSLSKIGTKALYKNGKMKKARPNTDKWNTLIYDGWSIKR